VSDKVEKQFETDIWMVENSLRTLHSAVCGLKTNGTLFFRELMAVCCGNCRKQINENFVAICCLMLQCVAHYV
jgi:hypothetical protein